jgi:GTPase SAR1 family protein
LLLETIKTIFTKIPGLGPEKIVQTFGLNVADIEILGYKVKLWDMGGKKDFRTMWKEYYKSCHALIYVVDASDPEIERLEESKKEFDNLTRERDLEGVPFMIMANYKTVTVPTPTTPYTHASNSNINGLIQEPPRTTTVGTEREQQIFRKIFIDTLGQGAGLNDCIYFVKTISALSGVGVEDSIQLLVKYLKDHARTVSDEDFI